MKYIIIFLFIPFMTNAQTISDTLVNNGNQLLIRVIDVSDTIRVNEQIENFDFEIELIEDELDRLRDELLVIKRKKAKYQKVISDKRNGQSENSSNNSPKDSPF